jgi:hypothetical protein
MIKKVPPTTRSAQAPDGVFCAGLPAVADKHKARKLFFNRSKKINFEKRLTLTLGHTLALYKMHSAWGMSVIPLNNWPV